MLSFTAQQIALLIQGKIEGDATAVVRNFGKIESAMPGEISFLANPKYEEFIYSTKASIIIVNESLVLKKQVAATLLRVPDAYAAFATLLTKYQEMKNENLVGIQSPSFIAGTAKLGEQNFVAAFAYIGENVQTGKQVKIFPGAVIGENVKIGNNVTIHAGVIIYSDCVLGDNVTIHSGSIIGSDGFGFAPKADGTYQKIPQLGNVIIEDDVEIGSNTTIDRATIGSTIIKKGVKIDNLIQIAHNVEIGENTVIAAQVGISGSTKIGKGVMMGGQSGTIGHLTIADGIKIAARTGITKDFKQAGITLSGYPAREQSAFLRTQVSLKNLSELEKRVKELEIMVQQLSQKG
ncbi:MAG: UDP-3-O-(3-hydroxymyristoyl)glucosamine N-acyltransferase [Chitinophagaceae bacterium]|jgi:UDP-3-O-[3-hydroxymyristoyl] glucosamine N-acyltransferase|nr:UDP-3-O-(3-hydroxymyristoyl)glucosamine N-acyltransferase [Chitinophagaceae bacterium]